ncbi:carboxypeptidase-like regulatory domain-containing protein [Psychroserpens burtonensis]|uniref:Carboxypeptidase-like regulatory domain-containing protein n=1 Tax=Psychroserpens burtonensis TaxID=49278 RepID=A0A5C7BFB6_9FLAO|nr:carboxypeptidase-like regulatory domain-containing protein [Psychroserpens burtonensis]TXE19885.1 carboxypeptidase-like regulatory domain-containing protein [Psychroserpens burtonensis]
MKFLNEKIVVIAFMLIPLFCISQSTRELLCKIIDAKTGEPVLFASVAVKNQNIGVISDDDGSFRLPITYKIDNAVIVISCMGYETIEVIVQTLTEDRLNIIKLKPKIESLEAITIIAKKDYISARDIVQKALINIPLNYPRNPHSYIGYYREYQVLNKRYFNLNEGIMEEFDAGFQTNKIFNKDNQAALYSFKKNKEFPQDSALASAYDNKNLKFIEQATITGFGGNELSILNLHNVIRYNDKKSFSFIDVFKEDFLYNHLFRLTDKTYLNDEPIYAIKFYALEEVTGTKNRAEGVIYIAYKNFSIHKLEYNGFTLNSKKPFYSLTVEYAPRGDKMFLNYVSFYNSFKAKSGNSFRIDTVDFDIAENAFLINFSNDIDESTITKKRRFKFEYNQDRLKIEKIDLISNRKLKITLSDELTGDEIEDFKTLNGIEYKIKNIADLAGRQLNELSFIDTDQFREYFVQQVFKNKELF